MIDRVIDDKMSDALGLTPINDPVEDVPMVINYPDMPDNDNLPAVIDNDIKSKQREQDINYARETMHSTIDQGNNALAHLVHFANTSGGPAAYKEVATMIKSMTAATTYLVKLHGGDSGGNKPKANGGNATQQNAQTINNNTTVMTTAEAMENIDETVDKDLWNDDIQFDDEE